MTVFIKSNFMPLSYKIMKEITGSKKPVVSLIIDVQYVIRYLFYFFCFQGQSYCVSSWMGSGSRHKNRVLDREKLLGRSLGE